jgi:hypothetical protein
MRDQTIIRAELTGADRCTAFGITAKGESPVLTLCRMLIVAGQEPATPLEAYRGRPCGFVQSARRQRYG